MERITLENTHFEGKNNVYLFDGEETVLVDTGVKTADTRRQLVDGLAEHGVSFADVDSVFVSHYHSDHAGLVAEIQEESDATVYAHPDDRDLIEGDRDAWEALRDRQEESFEQWGMPHEKREQLREHVDSTFDHHASGADTEPLEDGDRYDVGETELEVIHAPGHTAGLCAFAMPDRGEVLTSDAVLPVYTPNVGGADVRTDRPLERYVETLRRIADRDFDRAWPGHRDPIEEPADRALDIVHHHEERAWRVIRALAEHGPADAWTVSADLFGELDSIHILHGPGEAFAHLEHLARTGDLERTENEYRLTDDARERFQTRDDQSWPL